MGGAQIVAPTSSETTKERRVTQDSPGGGVEQLIARVLRRTGLSFPRGVLTEEVAELAVLIGGDVVSGVVWDDALTVATESMWGQLQAPILAAVNMHLGRADGDDREDLAQVLLLAQRSDATQPLARALTVRAATELRASVHYAEDRLRTAEHAVANGGRDGAVAAARALGAAGVALLDLDPEDFAPEIVVYIDADQSVEAFDELARITGDVETRAWAREALGALQVTDAPAASAAIAALTAGDMPDDPAEDAVWVPMMMALVDEGLERALAEETATAQASRE
jgi:hypothetical protein